ncbi:MAG: hypothetical protein V4772_05500 [Pseudomonadota bacterium]
MSKMPNATLLAATQAATARASSDDTVYPLPLLQWCGPSTTELQPFAPTTPGLPMAQYAVTCVMLWAQSQGLPGAIPAWEVGPEVWGVITFEPHDALTLTSIPISELDGFDPSNTVSWGALVQTWATSKGNQLAIPTFQTDGTNVTALVFGAAYPSLSFYDAPNLQLYQSLTLPGMLCNLQDPAVWAQSTMRVAASLGYGAGWPTWQWTTSRGLIGLPAFDYGPVPDASADKVANVLKVLASTVTMLQIATADSLADFSGIYDTFAAAPIVDEGLQILTDCIFGALQIGLNMIPDVGGVVASLVSTAMTVAQDAANQSGGGGGSYTLMEYQGMLTAASNATINYVSAMHDTLMDSVSNGTLQQVWTSAYADPLSGRSVQLGMLALASNDVVNGLNYWTTLGQQITSDLNTNLMASITVQLYTLQYRTYPNAPDTKQFWYHTIAEITAPGGDLSQYIASSNGENLSVWFTDFAVEPGHARGQYATATEWWLQAVADSALPEYPPSGLCYSLFSNDGFGVTTNWAGPFTKQGVYTQWFLTQVQIGLNGACLQTWDYPATGNLVTATISSAEFNGTLSAGYTDKFGNLYLNSSNAQVQAIDAECGFQQPVITNLLSPL